MDSELRAAFHEGSEFVQPPPGLADKVRGAGRRRRRRLVAVIAAAAAVLLVAAGGSYLLAGLHQPGPELGGHHRAQSGPIYLKSLPADYQVQQLAVSGPYLYVLTNGPDVLSAYDRATGKLVRAVTVPADPVVLAVGPGGLVWFVSWAGGGNSGGLWLLTADLRLRSAYGAVQTNVILPVGRTTALTPTQYGLLTVRMPAPGQPGQATAPLSLVARPALIRLALIRLALIRLALIRPAVTWPALTWLVLTWLVLTQPVPLSLPMSTLS